MFSKERAKEIVETIEELSILTYQDRSGNYFYVDIDPVKEKLMKLLTDEDGDHG